MVQMKTCTFQKSVDFAGCSKVRLDSLNNGKNQLNFSSSVSAKGITKWHMNLGEAGLS